jgi:hypothetical protein
MARLLLVIIVLGGAMVFAGVQQMRLASGAKPEPQTLSCAKLIESGPGDNAHVVMTHFIMVNSSFVTETGKSGGRWKNVWVPVVPLGGDYEKQLLAMARPDGRLPASMTMPKPREIRMIVNSSKVGTEEELGALAGQDTLQGMVVNKVSSLGSKQKKILADSYPGVNFDDVLVLEHGRKPSTAAKSLGVIAGGGALALAGVGGFVVRRRRV